MEIEYANEHCETRRLRPASSDVCGFSFHAGYPKAGSVSGGEANSGSISLGPIRTKFHGIGSANGLSSIVTLRGLGWRHGRSRPPLRLLMPFVLVATLVAAANGRGFRDV